jgi:hypothetical protein
MEWSAGRVVAADGSLRGEFVRCRRWLIDDPSGFRLQKSIIRFIVYILSKKEARLVSAEKWVTLGRMGVSQILDEIKSLPPEQRWEVLERTREMLGPEIPESFKQGMREIARGETVELDEALDALKPPQ